MSTDIRTKLRNFISERLGEKSDTAPFTDSDSLFVSGRLDSFDAMNLVMFLESEFGLDFSTVGFNQDIIDSIDAMVTLIGQA